MSTTDTIRAAFEAAVCKIVPRPLFLLNADGSYQEVMVQGFYSLWQAATEAAKATGTAGEPMTMSYVQNVPDQCDRITWRGAYYHLKEGAEAARQPAPAVNPEVLKEQASVALIQRRKIQDLQKTVIDLRAALAATAAPVLSVIRQAILDYYDDLTARKHGGVAMDKAFNKIQDALDMCWQDEALIKRSAATRSQP